MELGAGSRAGSQSPFSSNVCDPIVNRCKEFKTDELAALAEFNAFYDKTKDRLPASNGTIKTWHMNPEWRRVMIAASETLARLSAPPLD